MHAAILLVLFAISAIRFVGAFAGAFVAAYVTYRRLRKDEHSDGARFGIPVLAAVGTWVSIHAVGIALELLIASASAP